MANQDQHAKLCDAEKFAVKAMRDATYWVDNQNIRDSLKRAEFLLMELRFAAYFITDPECTEHLKQDAMKRLEQAIINCK